MRCRCALVLFLLVSLLGGTAVAGAVVAPSFESRFQALSQKTRQILNASPTELTHLLVRCDQLLDETTRLTGSRQKIMKKRLRRMRNLLHFVIDRRSETAPSPGTSEKGPQSPE